MSKEMELAAAWVGGLEEAERIALKLERSYRRSASRMETMGEAAQRRAQARAIHNVVQRIRAAREG